MRRFPRFMLVVACIHTKAYKKDSDILTEYLEGFPHIKNKCYGEYCNTTFYIIPNTAGFHRLLSKLTVSIIRNVLAYRVYERMLGNSGIVYLKYPFASSCNSLNMPSTIQIPTEDIDNFIAVTKVIKYD